MLAQLMKKLPSRSRRHYSLRCSAFADIRELVRELVYLLAQSFITFVVEQDHWKMSGWRVQFAERGVLRISINYHCRAPRGRMRF